MSISLLLAACLLSVVSGNSLDCSMDEYIYPHEWNRQAYYTCSNGCPYVKYCNSGEYYSTKMKKCQKAPVDWSPNFDLKGRYSWPETGNFFQVDQRTYDIIWQTEDSNFKYGFNGRYLNETMVTGLEIAISKTTNCIRIQRLDLIVQGNGKFCRFYSSLHWYSRTCGMSLSSSVCHTI